MESRQSQSTVFLRAFAIAWAIIGMQVDVISGPLPPESVPRVLCGLLQTNPSKGGPSPGATDAIVRDCRVRKVEDPIEAGPQLCEVDWPSPLITSRINGRKWESDVFRLAGPSGVQLAHSLRCKPREDRVLLPAMDLPLRLCRFLC